MSVTGRDKSKDRISERGQINARIGRVSFAKSMVHTATHARFPEIDFNLPVKPAVTETAQASVAEYQTPQAVTGASAVSHAMAMAQEQFRSEAGRSVERAIAEPGPVNPVAAPVQAEAKANDTLSPEQIQYISDAQHLVERAFNEPAA
ncbi:MAG TPA: hypothetical protein VHB72_01990 [Candidatus Saccharimonadales bacterium]|nr:hypothetical protein [Candidatus Saccharimonadales bacterium]